MKVTALQDFVVPNTPAFTAGCEYDIMEDMATSLIERGLVQEGQKAKIKVETMKEKGQRAVRAAE